MTDDGLCDLFAWYAELLRDEQEREQALREQLTEAMARHDAAVVDLRGDTS